MTIYNVYDSEWHPRVHSEADSIGRLAGALVAELVVFYPRLSMWMSIRSKSGPEMHFWYVVTVPGAPVQGLTESPK